MKRKSLPSSPRPSPSPYPPSSSPSTLSTLPPPSTPLPATPEPKRAKTSRTHLTSLATTSLLSSLSKEQVAYEQWVDTQPFGTAVAWEEMGGDERRGWCEKYLSEGHGEKVVGEEETPEAGVVEGRSMEGVEKSDVTDEGGKEREEAVGDLGESRWRAVKATHSEGEEEMVVEEQDDELLTPTLSLFTDSEPTPNESATEALVAESPSSPPSTTTPLPLHRPFRPGSRVWTATTTEQSIAKNKPQCPPCARLKRTWTRCRGGPPCVECQHRGLRAEQCQSYDLLNRSRKGRVKKKEEVREDIEVGNLEIGGGEGEEKGKEEEEGKVDGTESSGEMVEEKAEGENLGIEEAE